MDPVLLQSHPCQYSHVILISCFISCCRDWSDCLLFTPGVILTELSRERWFYNFQHLLDYVTPFFKSVKQGAQTTICCAVDEGLVNVTGKYYRSCPVFLFKHNSCMYIEYRQSKYSHVYVYTKFTNMMMMMMMNVIIIGIFINNMFHLQ